MISRDRQFVIDVIAGAILALIILAIIGPRLARADDPHRGGGDDVTLNNEVSTATSLATGDTRTIALSGGGLGDVDIYGCLASTQYSVFIFWARQGIKIDALCVADRYDLQGKHGLAAQLRCGVPLIARLSYAGTSCIEANTFDGTQGVANEPENAENCPTCDAPAEDQRARQDEHDEEIVAQQMYMTDLEKRLNAVEASRRANAARAATRQAEDAEYAQQMIQKLQSVDSKNE